MSTMPQAQAAAGTGYVLRTTTPADLGGARAVMLDTVYRDLRSGYVPRRHADIIDPDTACLRPDRCTLLVVECEGRSSPPVRCATADPRRPARSDGPRSPPCRSRVPRSP